MLRAPRTRARGARGGPGARGRTRGQSRPPGARWPAGRRETWDARVRVGRTTARCPGARSTVRAGRRAARFGRWAGRSRPSRPGGPAPGPCPRLLTSAGQFSAMSHRREAGWGEQTPLPSPTRNEAVGIPSPPGARRVRQVLAPAAGRGGEGGSLGGHGESLKIPRLPFYRREHGSETSKKLDLEERVRGPGG